MKDKFVTVAHFADYLQADLARQLLESHDITVVVTGQNVGNVYVGLAGIADVELKTPEDQAEQAREILEANKPPEQGSEQQEEEEQQELEGEPESEDEQESEEEQE